MIDAKALLADLQKLLTKLEDDIRRRCESQPEVNAPLQAQYAAAREANRTAHAYEVWRDDQITQAAVAWILGCVFVRFCEDNRLIDPPRLAGPGDRLQRARDEHTVYVQQHPSHTDREYLLWVFEQVATLPALRELFDHRHNPLWSLAPTGDGAMALRDFWQKADPATGQLVHDFTDLDFTRPASVQDLALDTRFLGDLYQDLSQSARKKYALLQTPIFVEKFLLDRTLEPAIREFGFRQVRMIDPTCGSGHLLLGGFHRLLGLYCKHEPNGRIRDLAQRALDGIYGVDVNPFAVAIARFRLLVAALRLCDVVKLDGNTPGFTLHLAAGDSLLHGPRPGRDVERATGHLFDDDPLKHHYETEDADLLRLFLGRQYHAVVGNPPYIVPKDRAENAAYRQRFGSCHMKYSLAVPFFERFVDLTLGSSRPKPNDPIGYFGMITANSFMKREFGKKIIEQFIPGWDLTHVIDTAGAYIPGHGTPTVILFGRHRLPAGSTIRTAMGIAGEPSTPADPARGQVWTAITTQLDQPDSESKFISVADKDRNIFHKHPWSIGGGGAAELKEILDEAAASKLADVAWEMGVFGITAADEAMVADPLAMRRRHCEASIVRPLLVGDEVRDWTTPQSDHVFFPYAEGRLLPIEHESGHYRWLWPLRSELWSRATFGQSTYREEGRTWWEWHQTTLHRLRTPLSIVFAEVATHNHFVLDRGGKVFKQTAPVIKLPGNATETDYLGLLGLLNSSLAAFWMKQVSHQKQMTGGDGVRISDKAKVPYAFNSTMLGKLPLPSAWMTGDLRDRLVKLTQELDQLATQQQSLTPDRCLASGSRGISEVQKRWADWSARRQSNQSLMVWLQEEIDFTCYAMFGIGDRSLFGPEQRSASVLLEPGQRPFCILAGRNMDGFFVPVESPAEWPDWMRLLWSARGDAIRRSPDLRLIEDAQYKRRWVGIQGLFNHKRADDSMVDAAHLWLLDRLEGWPITAVPAGPGGSAAGPAARSLVWDEREPRLTSVALLADRMRRDADFIQVAALYRGRDDFDLGTLVAELVAAEAVPFLPVLRYKESGLRNRRVWEGVWDLQRQEDAIDARTLLPPTDPRHLSADAAKAEKRATVGDIPVPPKYKSADMANATVWRLRGKLDVPKERFVSFPHAGRDSDPTPVITWAGFNHLQQMQALAAYYMDAKEQEGWPADRRVPLLAGMLELLPWVVQWHNDVDATFNQRMGDYFRDFINDEAREMGKTVEQIKAWTPPIAVRRRRASSRSTSN